MHTQVTPLLVLSRAMCVCGYDLHLVSRKIYIVRRLIAMSFALMLWLLVHMARPFLAIVLFFATHLPGCRGLSY